MFAKATKNFLKEVDDGGNLIAVSSLNDSDKLQLLSLVVKKNRFWCWQRPKYQFLSVTLGDVLTEGQFLSPVVVESDFVKYEGKSENHRSGSIETALGKVTLNAGGKGLVESQSSFGTLRKQEVDLQPLLRDAAERTINLKSPLLQQVLERRNEVLCVLTEKIVTTQKCVVSEHVQVEEKCGGMVGIRTKTVQNELRRVGACSTAYVPVAAIYMGVSAMEDGTITKDINVVLEIPASTTIAYSVLELYVKLDGQFEFCLLQGKRGGFEHETSDLVFLEPLPFREFAFRDMPDAGQGPSAPDEPLSVLKQVTLPLERAFRPFGQLPEQEQMALRGVLQVVLFDEELLVVLEQVCDDMVSGLPPPLVVLRELKPPQRQNLMAFLQLVGCSVQGEGPGLQGVVNNQKLFSTAYFLVSALAEMPDNAAALLGTCCTLQIIPTLCHLLHALSAGGDPDLEDTALAPLRDTEQFGMVQRLLATANVHLERRQSSVKAITCQVPNISPLVLYVSLRGLQALGRAHQ